MNNILLLVHNDPGLPARVNAALDLARSLEGKLICVDLSIPIVALGADPLFGTMVLEPDAPTDAQLMERARIENSGLDFQWFERRGELITEIAHFLPFADLVVLSSPRNMPFPDMRHAIGHLLVKAQKPVLAVPHSATGLALNGRAMLLWDGSHEASAALRVAVPLLRFATDVTVLEITDGTIECPADVAIAHLADNQINTHLRRQMPGGEQTGRLIIDHITREMPSFVVMGGFGHSRLLEGLFGGVTERVLQESPVPILLKH